MSRAVILQALEIAFIARYIYYDRELLQCRSIFHRRNPLLRAKCSSSFVRDLHMGICFVAGSYVSQRDLGYHSKHFAHPGRSNIIQNGHRIGLYALNFRYRKKLLIFCVLVSGYSMLSLHSLDIGTYTSRISSYLTLIAINPHIKPLK